MQNSVLEEETGVKSWTGTFDKIYWPGVEHVMKTFPRGFRNWVTKQVSGMCECTGVRCRWTKDLENRCPSCGGTNDTATHVTRCADQGRQDLWTKSVDDRDKWMKKNDTEPTLRTMIDHNIPERKREQIHDRNRNV